MSHAEVSFILWSPPFDVRRIRRNLRRQASQGLHLVEVVPPSFLHPTLTLRFAERDGAPPIEVRYDYGSRRRRFQSYKVVFCVVDDIFWMPVGHYYFLEKVGI